MVMQITSGNAQSVGINTTTPDGILDVNSNVHGIVLPRIALTSTNVAAPVTNPQGGALAVGTVVYNTVTTSTGSNDVYPGVYVWTGTEWFNKFTKKDAKIFKQTSDLRTASNKGYQDIPNLDSRTFTPKYTGTYRIELSVNFGGGYVQNISSDSDVLAQQGNFKFTFDGTDYLIPVSCYSANGTTQYYLIWEQSTTVQYQELTAATAYNFSLSFDQLAATGFVNNGNSSTGQGYIGYDIPCSIEFVFIGD
tara:strand:+ start:26131 stop:26880 length:750 start_codon:yes stop_codon:yes gene_type:complete